MQKKVHQNLLKGVDLNLLLVFVVLMRERSTTSAARCLCLSQSAVSQSLRRLRAITHDQLFLRDRRGVTPTPHAEALYADIMPSLETIEAALRSRKKFVPDKCNRHFRLRLMGIHTVALVPDLLHALQESVPNASISVAVGGENDMVLDCLQSNNFDLAIAFGEAIDPLQSWCRRRHLSEEPFACIYDGARLGIPSPITLDDYVGLQHVVPFLSPDRRTRIDEGLASVSQQRQVILTTDDYAGIPFYLRKIRALANFPLSAAQIFADVCGLSLSPLPFKTQLFRATMHWHGKFDNDTAHAWLRDTIVEIFARDVTPNAENSQSASRI